MIKPLLLAVPLAFLFSVAPNLASDAAHTLGLHGVAEDLSGVGVAEAAFIRRSKLKKKRTSGYKVVVVVGDDATSNEVDTVDVSIPHVPGQPTPGGGTTTCTADGLCETLLTLQLRTVKANGNKRFVFNQLSFSEDAANLPYALTTTMKDITDGPVGLPVDSVVEVVDAEMEIRTVTIQQLDEVNFQVRAVVVGDFANEVSEFWVQIDDYTGPDPEPDDSFILANPVVTGGKKVFTSNTLTFADPSQAADEVYSMIVSTVRTDGTAIGQAEFDVVVMGLEVDQIASLEAELAASHERELANLVDLELLIDAVDEAFSAIELMVAQQPDATLSTLLTAPTRLTVTNTYHFVDDWNGETAYLKVDDSP